MGAPKAMGDIMNELGERIRNNGSTIETTPKITKEILKEYIVGPSKEINLINSFLSTLKRQMEPMLRN